MTLQKLSQLLQLMPQFIALIGYSIQLISAIFIVICIFTVLILDAPLLAITSLYLVLIYSISIIVFKKKLNNNSLISKKCSAEKISIVQESIKGIRYIKLIH